VKVGLVPINVGTPSVEAMIAVARKAEEVGLESVWTFEHAIVPVDYSSKYPYSADGKMGVTPETNFVDPLVALSAVAASTTTLRLGTGVNILSQTNPLLLAKQAASLDFVSGGRFMLGVGIGWLQEEFDAMGTPFAKRGARFDDYLAAMRKVWSGDVVEHESENLHWTGWKSYPVPMQEPFPVVIGGSKGKAFDRVAVQGQGWFAPTVQADQLKPMLQPLEEACTKVDRDPSTVEISAMWIPAAGGMDSLKAYEDIGVSRLIIPAQALGGESPIQALDELGSSILSKL